ncbi:MAG: gfo/Idh/MocA family oxidoreductase [Chloroflexi bacterium]|nr:MAG: gfo/Idh/MocA family oxidoreductase [Chloroflexota bacterium]
MEPLRVGFIGAGIFATWAIYPSLYLAPIELKAVCDIDEEKAKSVANKFGTGRWYTDYRQMFEKEDLEAVIIWMRPKPRQSLVCDALGAGYHVMIPKPPAPSLADCLELAEASRRAQKVLMVDYQRRFSYGVRQAKEIMARPSFGKLTQLSASFCSGKYDEVRGVGYDGPVHAFLLDFSTHHLDLVRHIAGEIDQIAMYDNTLKDGGSFALAVKFVNGAVGTLQLNSQRVWWRNYDRIEITGEGEYIVVDSLWSVRHYTKDENTFTENYSDERSPELTGDGYALIEFVEAIRENREPVANIHDSLETMRIYQAMYDAYLAGKEGEIDLSSYRSRS